MARATVFERSISRILVNAVNETDKGPLHRDYKAHFRLIKKEDPADDEVFSECEYPEKSGSESSPFPALAMASPVTNAEHPVECVTKVPQGTEETKQQEGGTAKIVDKKKGKGGMKKKKGDQKKAPPITAAEKSSPRGQKRAADSPPVKANKPKRRKLSSGNVDETTCDVCHLRFASAHLTKAHRSDYLIQDQVRFTCKPCKAQFKRRRQLELHKKNAKCGEGSISMHLLHYFCHVCNQGMREKTSLQSHIYHFHDPADIYPGVVLGKPVRADAKSPRKRSPKKGQSSKIKRRLAVKVKTEPEEEAREDSDGQVLEKVQIKLGSPERRLHISTGDSVVDPVKEDRFVPGALQSAVEENDEEEVEEQQEQGEDDNVIVINDVKVALQRIDASLHPCQFCKQLFVSERQREAHVGLKHLVYVSSICEGKFPTMELLVRHFLEEHQTRPDVCCVCQETFEEDCDSHHLELHCLEAFVAARSEKPSRIREITCSGCDKLFTFVTCLQVHQTQCEPWLKSRSAVAMELDNDVQMVLEESKLEADACDSIQTVYPCDICGTRYRDYRNLWQHKQTYAGEMREQCSTCGLRFPSKKRLHGHVRATHDPSFFGEYKFRCKICNQGFGRLENCRVHEKHLHTEHVVSHKKNECDEKVAQLDHEPHQEAGEPIGPIFVVSLQQPVMEVSSPKFKPILPRYEGGPQVCDICGVGFASKEELLQHLFYFDPKESVRCTKCSQTFNGLFSLDNHHKDKHDVDCQNFELSCNCCNERFQNQVVLNSHMKHVHECQKVPSKPATKQVTKQVMSCKACGLKFLNSGFLTLHLAEYSNTGPYHCDRCDRRCQTQALLDKHREATHCDTSTRPRCTCTICGEVTRSELALEIHGRHFHALAQPPSEKKPTRWRRRSGTYKCPTCKAIFDSRQNLSAHLIDFANFGDFHCEVCDRKFTDAARLKVHREKHVNFDKSFYDFRCFFCTEGFFSKMALHTHLIHLHKTPDGASSTQSSSSRPTSQDRNSSAEGFFSDTEPSSPQQAPEPGVEGPKTIPCNVCGIKFRHIKDLRKHQYRYLNNGDFMCDICGRRFLWSSLFYHHYEKHMDHKLQATLKYKCRSCGERFSSLTSSRAHFIHIHSELSKQGAWRSMIEWIPDDDPKIARSEESQGQPTNETIGYVLQNQGPVSLLEPPPLTVRNSNIVVPDTPPGLESPSPSSGVAILEVPTLAPARPQQMVSLLKDPSERDVIRSVSTVPRKVGLDNAGTSSIPEPKGAQSELRVSAVPGGFTTKYASVATTRYACVSCGNFYQTLRDLENHYQMMHSRQMATEVREEDAIADHQYFMKPVRKEPVKCNCMCMKCWKTFLDPEELRSHDKFCQALVAHKCDVCNTYFFDPNAWKCHMEYAHGFVQTEGQQERPRANPTADKNSGAGAASSGRNGQKEVRQRLEKNVHPRRAQTKPRGPPNSEKANTTETREKPVTSAGEKKIVGGLRVRPFAKIIENLARESAHNRERKNCALGEGPQDF